MVSEELLDELGQVVSGQNEVVIFTHNDPDPDAIAAAVALRYLLDVRYQVHSTITYRGLIGRAENKALVKYLKEPLKNLRQINLEKADRIALVDTQPGAGNNALPKKYKADIVIDHHPLRPDTQSAQFADIQLEIGATSTLLTSYLLAAEIVIPPAIATALFFGIKTDTMGLSRNANPKDVQAYFHLQSLIDVNALVKIEQAQVPMEYFQSIDSAIHACKLVDQDTVIVYMGALSYPDLGAELADFFMRLIDIKWVLCMGVFKGELILSIRSRSKRIGAGQLITEIIAGKGSAGGHGSMAAGHIELDSDNHAEQLAEGLEQKMILALKGTLDVSIIPLIPDGDGDF